MTPPPSTTSDTRPIGVFDSGVGGLTVWRALKDELPNESFIYLGDTARVPYGNKSAKTVERYALNIADELVERHCKALVIACNTASAFAYDAVAQGVDIPVVDVVRPVAFEVATHTEGTIAVLGTRGTVSSGAYPKAIRKHNTKRTVVQQACPLFVPLAEEGWINGDIPCQVAEKYLRDVCDKHSPEQFILGCTHYPMLSNTLLKTLESLLGDSPVLHDSGQATARRLRALLEARNLASSRRTKDPHWLVTDSPDSFRAIARQFIGSQPREVEHVDIIDRHSAH